LFLEDEMSKNKNPKLTRREMLKLMGTGVGAAILAGCAAEETEVPAVVEPGEPAAEPVTATIRYQNHWTKETDAHYEGMNWLYDAFGEAYPNITVENILNPDSQESYKKITADCAAGDCPEIIHGPGPEMWESGYLLDLKPYLDDEWMNVIIPSTIFKSGDAVWGLCGEYSPMPTIWNTRILDAAGVSEIPATWDDFMDVCDKVKASGKTPTSWEVGGVHQWHNIVMSQAGGYEALANDQFDAPQIREAFARLKTFVDNKWVPDNEIELSWQQSVALFVAEETAFYLNGAWTLNNEIRGEGAAADLRENVHFGPYPKVGDNGTTVELKTPSAIAIAKAVEDDPAKLEAAITFLKFWFSEEGGKQWILLTQSPMGVAVDVNDIEGVDPLLVSFLGAKDQADTVYSLPPTKAMQQRGWDDAHSGYQALLVGGSVDDAMDAFINEMSQY
jgi:raffinose/stachyose/melibiose transport system substrate-binding protein